MNTKPAPRAFFLFPLILLSLSCISDLSAQEQEGKKLNIAQALTLSQQFSQFGGRFYPITNVFSNWNVSVVLPKSEYMLNLGLGGHLYDTGGRAGRRFGIYTSLFNSFDFATVHRLSERWSLQVTDSFFHYPNLNRYGYGSLLQYNTAVNGQVGALDNFKNFKISPFGAGGPQGGRFNSTALAAAATSSYFPGFGPGFGYYGYYPLFLGSLTNDLAATLTYAINSKSTLDFSYDNSYMNFKSFGAFKSQWVTAQYSWQYNSKGSLSFAYSIGRFSFKEPVLRNPQGTQEELEKAKLDNRRHLNDSSEDPEEPENDNPYRPGLTHTFTVGTSYQLTPDLGVEFSIGPSITTSNVGNTVYLDFTTLVSLVKEFRRSSVSAEYFRYVTSSYGYGGAALTQGVDLTYSRPLSRRLDWTLSGTYFDFTDIFGIFSPPEDCNSVDSNNCNPSTSGGKRSSVSGAFITTNLHWRMTKRLNTNLGFTYFKGNTGRINRFFIPGFAPYGAGSGLYNTITFDYPLRRNLIAFINYSFISSSFLRSGPSYGNTLAVGITHTNPSIFKIGRQR